MSCIVEVEKSKKKGGKIVLCWDCGIVLLWPPQFSRLPAKFHIRATWTTASHRKAHFSVKLRRTADQSEQSLFTFCFPLQNDRWGNPAEIVLKNGINPNSLANPTKRYK